MSVTLPTNSLQTIIRGDLDLVTPVNADNGDGTVYIRNGNLYVEGISDLDQTTINTTDGEFAVSGSNRVTVGVTAAIELTAAAASFFTTSSSTLALTATNTTSGKVTITGAGTGTDSVLVQATNTTSGQLTLQSAGGSTSTKAVQILASDTTDGDVYIKGSGSFAASNPAVLIEADNATSGQISILSAGDSGSVDSILINATGTTGGNVAITAAGSGDPAIKLDATSNSGQILIQTAGDQAAEDSISILANGTTGGNVVITGSGTNASAPGVSILANNATSGQVTVQGSGNIAAAVRILASNATGGGIDIDATGGAITIDTANTTTGITMATGTAGVPVTIGTASSLTTVVGNLTVLGDYIDVRVQEVLVEDNFLILNSGNGELDIDSGIAIRRFQTANGSGTGNVATSDNPIEESGAFQAGSATPGTLVLAAHASASDDFYNGKWIKITSGTGINQVGRIKDYVGSTKTVTLFVAADNSTAVVPNIIDGRDLTAAPAAADTYEIFTSAFVSNFFDESKEAWTIATITSTPATIDTAGVSTASIEQYQKVNTGELDIYPLEFDNVFGSASTTTITFTVRGHGRAVGEQVYVSNSSAFTPAIPTAAYLIQTVPTANTFTITVPSSTTSTSASSATVGLLNTSRLRVNVIEPHDPSFGGISIAGFTDVEDVLITKTSTSAVNITKTIAYGSYFMLVANVTTTTGSYATFALSSAGSGGSVTRLTNIKGADNERIDAQWTSTNKVQLFQSPAGSGAGQYTYRVRILKVV